jgi:hypothetical protein
VAWSRSSSTADGGLHQHGAAKSAGLDPSAAAQGVISRSLSSECAEEAKHDADELVRFFQDVRGSLTAMRRDIVRGNQCAVRSEAYHIERRAKQLGANGVRLKAKALKTQPLAGMRSAHLDALEQQLDASEAIYQSCRLRV